MSFPRDAYPYTNFHELNLGYFITHFREIFSQWADLYDQMLNWKDATDEELATWKAVVEADLDQREAALRAELETWKAQTGQDIAGWEDATLAALTAWQTATQAVFEAIRVEAASSASAAAASAGDAATAKTAAETAQAAAEAAAAGIASSAAQIATNTEDISELKTHLLKYSEIDLNAEESHKAFITSGRTWGEPTSTSQTYCNIIPIPKTVTNIIAESTHDNSYIAFLTSDTIEEGQPVSFSANHNGRITVPNGGSVSFSVDSDMLYMYVLRATTAGADTTPAVTFRHMQTDKTLSETYVPAEAKVVGDALNKTLAWLDPTEVQAAISAGGILSIVPGKYFTANGSEIASLFGAGNYPDSILAGTDYIVESYHYGSSNRAYFIRRANGAQIFWGRYNGSNFAWYDLSPEKDITVSSYDGGTELHAQTVNTICRVTGVSGITDAPDDVDLNTYVGWLWTYGGTNKQQLLFYPHNNAIYQCIYRSAGGVWGWSKWFMISAAPRKTLKILAVGNSFTYSTLGYLPQIMSAMNPNIDFTLGICYDSGESIAGHIEKMTIPTTENPETYEEYSLWRSGASKWTNSADSKTLKWALLSDDWDYIVLQEAPTQIDPTSSDTDPLKTLAGLITTYMRESHVTHPFNFLYNLPQCYGPNYTGLSNYCTTHDISGADNEEKSDGVMEYIAAYAERALSTPYVIGVLPGGMAVQNARQIAAFKAIGASGYLYLTNDNIGHLQNGFGPLIAGYANAMKLLELIGDKIPAFSIPFAPTNEWLSTSGLYTKSIHGAIDETANTDANFIKAQQCALMAYKNPFEISEI